jgi:hypothetical protein
VIWRKIRSASASGRPPSLGGPAAMWGQWRDRMPLGCSAPTAAITSAAAARAAPLLADTASLQAPLEPLPLSTDGKARAATGPRPSRPK